MTNSGFGETSIANERMIMGFINTLPTRNRPPCMGNRDSAISVWLLRVTGKANEKSDETTYSSLLLTMIGPTFDITVLLLRYKVVLRVY